MCRTGVIKGGVYGDLIKIRQILKPQKEKANNATKTESSIQSGIIGRFGKRYAGGWASRGLEQESGEVSNIQNYNDYVNSRKLNRAIYAKSAERLPPLL